MKFSPAGVALWSKSFGSAQAPEESGTIALDAAGNVYLHVKHWFSIDFGGGPPSGASAGSLAVVKLDAQGNHVWSKPCIYIVKLDASGNYVWGLAPGLTGPTSVYGLTTDSFNNVYTTGGLVGSAEYAGTLRSANGGGDVYMAKLSPAGAHLASQKYGGANSALGRSIAVDPIGNAFLTGSYSKNDRLRLGCLDERSQRQQQHLPGPPPLIAADRHTSSAEPVGGIRFAQGTGMRNDRTGKSRLPIVAGGIAAAGWLARKLVRRARRLDLHGRGVIVTGGSRGLGLLMAHELGRLGAKVAICGRDPEAVENARLELARRGIEVFARACDLGDRRSAEDFVDDVERAFGRIDALINSAGIIQVAPVDSVTVERIEEAMRSNFWSAVHVTMRALPHLRRAPGRGRLVNVVSIGGRAALPHMLGYSASKFALMGWSEGLLAELASGAAGVRVTTVVPAPMRTGSFYNAEFGGRQAAEFSWFSLASSTPVVSSDAKKAARRIVAAMRDGRSEVRIGIGAHALSLLHGLAPAATARALGVVNRMLPDAPDGPTEALRKGRDVASSLPERAALRRGNRAALENNEAPPPRARG